ncbi:hypothetical protein Bhyg_09266 [Pseudolycoriella hygida]|uniref:Uncharacterized protein n=1 Tax=Pseudolycoriella hygida TaxID=35572 RepID=A0A9Q0N6B8_9DIPT|nr:hypothetical protein Bhyg_09266 [Pseudolycoriella hygida]
MQLYKVILFACLIYGASARDFMENLDPYIRRIIEASRSIINRECKNAIESQRDNFKTGWPIFGIGPLDPYFIDRFEMAFGTTNLTLLNANLSGISDFIIEYCDLKVLGMYAGISLRFNKLIIDGQHETKTKLGLTTHQGRGDAEITFHNVDVSVDVQFGVIGQNRLNMDEMNFNIHVKEVKTNLTGFGFDFIDKLVSEALGDTIKLAINLYIVLLFACRIYGVSARDFMDNLDPYIRQIIEASQSIINRECKNVIESQRDNLKTGWPIFGIGPLDPYFIDRFEMVLGITNLTLLNANLSGISDFIIEYCDLKVLGIFSGLQKFLYNRTYCYFELTYKMTQFQIILLLGCIAFAHCTAFCDWTKCEDMLAIGDKVCNKHGYNFYGLEKARTDCGITERRFFCCYLDSSGEGCSWTSKCYDLVSGSDACHKEFSGSNMSNVHFERRVSCGLDSNKYECCPLALLVDED